jgi:HD-GYP domain-containing protein (c-di-GMP phosphodiesterase class II)
MKEIDLSLLQVGQTTECEYLSSNGDLLISRGVVLTQQHVDALHRRGIASVFMREEHEEDELHKILLAEFEQIDDLAIDDLVASKNADHPVHIAPSVSQLSEFKDIKGGKEGLFQLINTRKGSELDSRLKEGRSPDKPVGPALKDRATQFALSDRTEQYKSSIAVAYEDALKQTETLLSKLARGENVDGGSIRSIITKFVPIYLNDRNILLNLSGIKAKNEEYIFSHSLNVCILSISIAASIGYNEQQVIEIGMGALLHDLGMLMIAQEVFMKKGRLDEQELYEIQKHPILGLHLLEKINHLPESIPYMAYQSHERENGKGYPKQRSSRLIHCFAKVIQIADIYEALSSPRSYREAYLPYKAIEFVIKMTRQGLISGEFVKAFLEYTSLFPVGSIVELSNGYRGKVIRANQTSLAKPVVMILMDSKGIMLSPDKYHEEDLSTNTSIQIVKALSSDFGGISLMQGF